MIKYNLSDILQIVNKSFNKMFYDFDFWFKAQVTRIKEVKGNIYLDLVETDKKGSIKAKARGLIFDKKVWSKFIKKINLIDYSQLKNYQILCHGKVNFHKQYGIGIVIKEISSEYVLGQIQQDQQDIIQRLKKQNLWQKNLTTSLGYPPYSIAILSSQTSDGLKDFQSTLQNSQYKFKTTVFDTPIHGNKAKKQVAQTLKSIYEKIQNKNYHFDALAIVRGGGASSGILRQNDRNIAKYISQMPIPVILAIGHTRDKFILDKLAKHPCKTPSDGAHFLIKQTNQREQNLINLYQPIDSLLKTKLEKYKYQIDNIYEQINTNYQNRISNIQKSLKSIYQDIQSFDLDRMTKKGYGILIDKNNTPLSKQQIKNLKKNDKLSIKIYDQKIDITIR